MDAATVVDWGHRVDRSKAEHLASLLLDTASSRSPKEPVDPRPPAPDTGGLDDVVGGRS